MTQSVDVSDKNSLLIIKERRDLELCWKETNVDEINGELMKVA